MKLTPLIPILLCLLAIAPVYAFSGSGSGNSTDPFQITTCSQLQEINNNQTAHYLQMNNINCSATIGWNGGNGFIPIGTFNGTLNGGNFNVSGVFIKFNSTGANRGFFNGLNNGIIKNFHLTNINYTNPSFSNTNVGGLVGRMDYGSIINCSTTGTININGGVVGGLIGLLEGGLINTSYSIVNINATSGSLGGLIGNAGTMSGTTIQNSYAHGSVSCSGYSQYGTGGLIGYYPTQPTLSNSYSTGLLSVGSGAIGGFIGYAFTGSQVSNSFWDMNRSGQNTTSFNKGTGKTTPEMYNQNNYTGWDFTNVWEMCSDPYLYYPHLKGQAGCLCVPEWVCSGYSDCQPNNTQPCISVIDLNTCNQNYIGNYSEFTQACNYSVPTAEEIFGDVVAYYKLDNNNLSDEKGNYNLTNEGTTNTSGFLFDGREFDSGYLDLPYRFPVDNYSVSVWVYLTSYPNDGATIFAQDSQSDASPTHELSIKTGTGCGDGAIYVQDTNGVNNGALGGYGTDCIGNVPLNVWTHLVLISNGSHLEMFVNGVKNQSDFNYIGIQGTNNLAYVGMLRLNYPQIWLGKIDELGIWNRVLTDAEAIALYNGGAGLEYPFMSSCVPSWFCSGWGDCLENNTQMCDDATDLNMCDEPYTGDYSEFGSRECVECEPSWVCDGYSTECVGGFYACNVADDIYDCGIPYGGNYSEFEGQMCQYESHGYTPQFSVGDIPNLTLDTLGGFITTTTGYMWLIIIALIIGCLLYALSRRR